MNKTVTGGFRSTRQPTALISGNAVVADLPISNSKRSMRSSPQRRLGWVRVHPPPAAECRNSPYSLVNITRHSRLLALLFALEPRHMEGCAPLLQPC
jgi:hypothetical protein